MPLRDMISLGAWRMGLGCSGKILPSPPSSPPPSSPPPSPTRIWKTDSSRGLLRNRSFRSARIDPSRRAVAEGYMYVKQNPYKNQVNFVAPCSRSEGFALTGYDIPGRVEDGGWMLWENYSVAVVAVVAHPGWGGGAENSAFPRIKSQKCAAGRIFVI